MKQLAFSIGGSKSIAEQFSENLNADQQGMAHAATLAFREGAVDAKQRGRTNIGAAGFSTKWKNALRVNVYPATKDSLRPAIYMYHKIPYAGVFEDSATIKGQPTLWVPVPGLAKRFGKGERITPSSFERATGQHLVPFRDPNTGVLLLGVRIKVPKKTSLKTLSLTRLRRGEGGKQGVLSTVPVFVGVKQVHIPRKFGLTEVMEGLASELPGRYVSNRE